MSRRSAAAPVQLEASALIPNICHGTTEAPTAPDAAPTYVFRNASGLGSGSNLISGTMSAISGVTGGYYINRALAAADGFAAGETYAMIITYTISSTTFRDIIDVPIV